MKSAAFSNCAAAITIRRLSFFKAPSHPAMYAAWSLRLAAAMPDSAQRKAEVQLGDQPAGCTP